MEKQIQTELSESATRVQRYLESSGLSLQVVELTASTRTAADAAAAIGCQVAQIVKSLVFRGTTSQQAILVVASGINRVDEAKVGALAGEPLGKADADFVREQTGYVIGGVPPVAHKNKLLTFIDKDLMQYEEIWGAAGTPNAVFRLTPSDLASLTAGSIRDVKLVK